METRKHKHQRGSLGIPLRWWTVIGAVLAFLAFGACYCWGTITIYVTSYVRKYEPNATYGETMAVYAGALIAQASSMWLGGIIEKKIGPRLTMLLGGYIFTAGVLLAALATTTWGLVFTYGIFTGAGIGIGYAAPLMCTMKNFPNKEGMVAGIVVAGFGFGAVIWNQVATVFVNPDNESIDENGDDDEYYDGNSSVAKRVPSMFLLLGSCFFVMFTVGSMLIHVPDADPNTAGVLDTKIANAGAYEKLAAEEDDEEVTAYVAPSDADDSVGPAEALLDKGHKQLHPKELLVYPLFYLLIASFVATVCSGLIVSLTYKTYGSEYWDDDHFLSMVGSVAAAFSTIGRIGWGKVSDLVGNKRAMQMIAVVFVVLLVTYPFTTVNRNFYAVWTWLILSCYGGNFAIYPATVKILFGEKYASANYGLTFMGFGYVTVVIILTISNLHVPFPTLCMISAALTVVGLGCLTLLPKF